jgi:hypothetical protein
VPAVPLPGRAKNKQKQSTAATMNPPVPETRQNGEVTQQPNGSLLSTPLADGVAIQDSYGLESNMADVEVNKDVEESSEVTPDNDLEDQTRG